MGRGPARHLRRPERVIVLRTGKAQHGLWVELLDVASPGVDFNEAAQAVDVHHSA
jgi:hypothetical protein